jgi:hypothetical protein
MAYMLKYLIILAISIPFASFFIFLGMFISLLKNYRNSVVLIIFIWLLLIVIIPQSAQIIAIHASPTLTDFEYNDMRSAARSAEVAYWQERFPRLNMIVVGQGIDENLPAANNARDVAVNMITLEQIADSRRQTNVIQAISNISPLAQFEKISEIIFNKGFYNLEFKERFLRQMLPQIRNLMIEQDSRDIFSDNHFFRQARMWNSFASPAHLGGRFQIDVEETDRILFSETLFEHPDLLFVTSIPTDTLVDKTVLILLRLIPILALNLVLIVMSVTKLEKLDIR